MTQTPHLVFGGELEDPGQAAPTNPDGLHIVGVFPDYASAYDAWKVETQRCIHNARMRFFIASLQSDPGGTNDPSDGGLV